jgi:hypothetical protein
MANFESGSGRKVKSRRQAIAIALNEAGSSKYESPKENRRAFRKTKEKERKGETGMDEKEGRGASRRITRASRKRSAGKTSAGRRSARGARSGDKTKGELYVEARKKDIPGRSKMSKSQLARALKK